MMYTTIICQYCNKEFQVKPSRATKAKFCSKTCFYTARRKSIERICPVCGIAFRVVPSRLTWGRGKYCSPACQYAAIKSHPSSARVDFTCLYCGKEFWLYQSRVAQHKGAGKYCSRQCRDRHRIGENHPQYINGEPPRYGPNWQAQKRKAKRRDKWTCQVCGITHKEHLALYGLYLAIHHKIPFRKFASYLEANQLSNLTTACSICHRKLDAAFQAQE